MDKRWGVPVLVGLVWATVAVAQTDRHVFPAEIIADDDTLATPAVTAAWVDLEPGLAVAHFDSRLRLRSTPDGGDLTVLRVDPNLFSLQVLQIGSETDAPQRALDAWCVEFGLVAAINAGMYQADGRTHVGFCQQDGRVVNGFANDYLSAVAFDPVNAADPPFRIFDLDETPLRELRVRYRNVVQNLRLIKRERENRWQPSLDQWRESALAEDAQGRILLVYCRTSWSMAQFNDILLALPLEVVAAQHLEGRHQARFRINHPLYTRGPESGLPGPAIPIVLGVVRRPPTAD